MLQNGANLRYGLRIRFPGTPSVSNAVQACENARKNSALNYESPALTAELQAQRGVPANIEHPTFNVQLTGTEVSAVRWRAIWSSRLFSRGSFFHRVVLAKCSSTYHRAIEAKIGTIIFQRRTVIGQLIAPGRIFPAINPPPFGLVAQKVCEPDVDAASATRKTFRNLRMAGLKTFCL